MKKILLPLLVLCLAFCLVACGNAELINSGDIIIDWGDDSGEERPVHSWDKVVSNQYTSVDDLLADGYEDAGHTINVDDLKWGFSKTSGDNNITTLMVAECTLTEEEQQTIEDMDFFAEDNDEKILNILKNSKTLVIYDLAKYFPVNEDELTKYVGKTVGDMLDEGWECTGASENETTSDLFLDGDVYAIQCRLNNYKVADYSNFTEEDKAAVITEVYYVGMSAFIFD